MEKSAPSPVENTGGKKEQSEETHFKRMNRILKETDRGVKYVLGITISALTLGGAIGVS